MLRKFVLAASLALGFAAAAPQGASAAPMGPGLALHTEAAPATVQKAYYYRRHFFRRRFYGRPYFRRRFYGGPRFFGPRRFYGRPYYRRRFYY